MKKFLIALMILCANVAHVEAAEILSLNLEEIISLALQNNPSITQSFEDREAASWTLSQARRKFGPTLSYNFTGKRRGVSNQGQAMKTGNDFTNGLTVSIPIYQGGRLRNQKESARFSLNSADLTLEDTKQSIKLQATNAYYDVLKSKKMLEVHEEEVNNLQAHLDQTQIRFREGVVAKPDVLASIVSLANARQNYVSARGDYEKSLASLNNVMNLPTDTPLVIRDEMNYIPYELELESCTEYALKNRPDYAAALYSIKQAEMAIEVAKADSRPSVSASLSNSFEGDRNFKSNTNRNWQAAINATWNIFDNNVTGAAVHEKQAQLRKAQSRAEQTAATVCLEVKNAHIALQTAEENISTTKIAVARAEEDCRLEQIRYAEGIGTNLEILDAQEKLTQARSNYYNALHDYNVAKAQLDKAMGVPIDIDVPSYIAAEESGKNSEEALNAAIIKK